MFQAVDHGEIDFADSPARTFVMSAGSSLVLIRVSVT